MADQETLREIKRILELTSRIDERVNSIVENNTEMSDKFDKFIDQHNRLTERVTRIESNTWTAERIEAHLEQIKDEQKKVTNRIIAVETTAPYALQIIDQLNKLTDRVSQVEAEQKDQGQKVKTWHGWIEIIFNWVFKIAWVVIAAYILARVGLGGVNIPVP